MYRSKREVKFKWFSCVSQRFSHRGTLEFILASIPFCPTWKSQDRGIWSASFCFWPTPGVPNGFKAIDPPRQWCRVTGLWPLTQHTSFLSLFS